MTFFMFCAIVETNKTKNRKVDYEYEYKIFVDNGESSGVGGVAGRSLVLAGTGFFHLFYLVGSHCGAGVHVYAADIYIFSKV